jgi:hypothetical protein
MSVNKGLGAAATAAAPFLSMLQGNVCAMRSLYAPSLSLVLANLRGFSLRALLDSDSGNQRPRTVTPARLKDRKTASVPYSAPRSTTMHDECRQIVGTVIASITGAIVISRLS